MLSPPPPARLLVALERAALESRTVQLLRAALDGARGGGSRGDARLGKPDVRRRLAARVVGVLDLTKALEERVEVLARRATDRRTLPVLVSNARRSASADAHVRTSSLAREATFSSSARSAEASCARRARDSRF